MAELITSSESSNYAPTPKYAYALMIRAIHETPLKLLSQMVDLPIYANYDFYVVSDDNNQDINSYASRYPRIRFVQVKDSVCFTTGYINMNYSIKKTPTAWDKSFYFFTFVKPDYNFVWFVEDDVFVPNPDAIWNIDQKYAGADGDCVEETAMDLLVRMNNRNDDPNNPNWNWHVARGKIDLPWFQGFIPTCRVSRRLLFKIRDYVAGKFESAIPTKKDTTPRPIIIQSPVSELVSTTDPGKRTMFFLEIMVNTICMQSGFNCKVIPELLTIQYRMDWKYGNIVKNQLYHPIKNYDVQKAFYEIFNKTKL
jgi:hypothetical protein